MQESFEVLCCTLLNGYFIKALSGGLMPSMMVDQHSYFYLKALYIYMNIMD